MKKNVLKTTTMISIVLLVFSFVAMSLSQDKTIHQVPFCGTTMWDFTAGISLLLGIVGGLISIVYGADKD